MNTDLRNQSVFKYPISLTDDTFAVTNIFGDEFPVVPKYSCECTTRVVSAVFKSKSWRVSPVQRNIERVPSQLVIKDRSFGQQWFDRLGVSHITKPDTPRTNAHTKRLGVVDLYGFVTIGGITVKSLSINLYLVNSVKGNSIGQFVKWTVCTLRFVIVTVVIETQIPMLECLVMSDS